MRTLVQAVQGLLRSYALRGVIAVGMARELVGTALKRSAGIVESISAPFFRYDIVCRGPDGEVKWRESFCNLVTTGGKNDLLNQYFTGSAYTAAWYVGLVDNAGFAAIAATDTSAAHAGWTEAQYYSQTTRPALTLAAASGGSITNSASEATYSINGGGGTVNGAFVISNSTKGGATGVLYSAGSFAATRTVASGDTLTVQVTLSV